MRLQHAVLGPTTEKGRHFILCTVDDVCYTIGSLRLKTSEHISLTASFGVGQQLSFVTVGSTKITIFGYTLANDEGYPIYLENTDQIPLEDEEEQISYEEIKHKKKKRTKQALLEEKESEEEREESDETPPVKKARVNGKVQISRYSNLTFSSGKL